MASTMTKKDYNPFCRHLSANRAPPAVLNRYSARFGRCVRRAMRANGESIFFLTVLRSAAVTGRRFPSACRSKAKIPLIGAAVNLQLYRFARSAKQVIELALLVLRLALRLNRDSEGIPRSLPRGGFNLTIHGG